MLFTTSSLVLALATGFAAAGPVRRSPEPLPGYKSPAKRNGFGNNDFQFKDVNAFNQVNGFDFNGAINQFNNVNQVFQFQEQNLQIVDNGIQQAVIQQVNEVLIVDQQQNRFNDLFRQSNFRNNFNDVTTVVMVVQQIQVAVDDGRGGIFQQDIFAQSAVIANQGLGASQTILVSDERSLVATQVLNGFGGGFGGGAIPTNVFANGSNDFPTRTNNIGLFAAAPTWSAIQRDPAAILGVQWQAELVNLLDNNVFELQNAEELKILEALKGF